VSVHVICSLELHLHLQEIDALVSQSEAITGEKIDQVRRLSFIVLCALHNCCFLWHDLPVYLTKLPFSACKSRCVLDRHLAAPSRSIVL